MEHTPQDDALHPPDASLRPASICRVATLRLRWAAALAVAVVGLEMAAHVTGHVHGLFPITSSVAMLLTVAVVVLVGRATFAGAAAELLARNPGRHSLMVLTVFAAFGYSLATLMHTWNSDLRGGVYFEVVAVVLVASAATDALFRGTLDRSQRVRELLLTTLPASAAREAAEGVHQVPLGSLSPGDVIVVSPGEVIAADGVIIHGETSVDEGTATGEWVPVVRAVGDRVIAGTRNLQREVKVRVLGAVAPGSVGSPAERVEHGQIPDQFELSVSRALLGLALLLVAGVVVWWGVFKENWEQAIHSALSVLIVSCPCALVLARPLALHRGILSAAGLGVAIRSADALDKIARARTVIFDKTGTLTKGFPVLVESHTFEFFTDDKVLAMAASAERGNDHPIARAICGEAARRGLELPSVDSAESLPGEGVVARLASGPEVIVGNSRLLERHGVYFPAKQTIERINAELEGKSLVWVARKASAFKEPVGVISFRDELKPDAEKVLRELRSAYGLAPMLVSGDHDAAVRAAASGLPIPVSGVIADASPSAKAQMVHTAQREGSPVVFVGDGTNDMPALRAADVGIALGGGSRAAKSAGQVVLTSSDLSGLPRLFAISREYRSRVRRNSAAALAAYALLLPLAASGRLTPLIAMGAMMLSLLLLLGADRSSVHRSKSGASHSSPQGVHHAT